MATPSPLLALDVALLLPPAVSAEAERLSASIQPSGEASFRLDAGHLPHITLTQQFVSVPALDASFAAVGAVLRGRPALRLRTNGIRREGRTVWLEIAPTPELTALHMDLMAALRPFEQPSGSGAAFVDADTRARSVAWVENYRGGASFARYRPHITLGHGEPFERASPIAFEATTVAACHLGHFCTCRSILREWRLMPHR